MNATITRWVIGITCTAIWFWGNRASIPDAAITLSASIVPGLIGHALASQPYSAIQTQNNPPSVKKVTESPDFLSPQEKTT